MDGSLVNNSIPVTGWALDDIGIASVKIYNGDIFIGKTRRQEWGRQEDKNGVR